MLYFLIFCCFLHFVHSQQDIINFILQESAIVVIDEEESIGPAIDYNQLGEPKICGYSSKSQKAELQNIGDVAKIRDWPWIAALVNAQNISEIHCGGAIITRRHILTAAHCYRDKEVITKDQLLVRLGEYYLNREIEPLIMDYRVDDLRIPEDYDAPIHHHDIAILKLDRTIEYNVHVQPICLPLPQDDYTDTTGDAAGWGLVEYNGFYSNVLLEVSLPIWDLKKCRRRFASTIFCTNICAGFEEGVKDTCTGDSGGPLVQQRQDGRWTVIGVVSWGRKCAMEQSPGIYTAVNKYLNWIAENIQDVDSEENISLEDSVISTALQTPF